MNPIKHVAIIMDGNGRWGIKNKKSRNLGHKAGLATIEKIIKKTVQKKIKFLTLYAFSTENWKRPKREVQFLFNLLEEFLITKTNQLNKQDIKFAVIGSRKNFSKKLLKILLNSETSTKNNKSLQINLALNYGFKNELINFKKEKETSPQLLANIKSGTFEIFFTSSESKISLYNFQPTVF